MRMKLILAVTGLCGLAGLAVNQSVAVAADLDRPAAKKRVYHHHRAHGPRVGLYLREDPYAYQYEPRGYYPYYRAGYWAPAALIRYRNRLHYNVWNTQPPRYAYYQSWGYPLRYWDHYRWHAYYHGRQRPWHW